MADILTPLDLAIFAGSLLLVMAAGLWAGWKEETSTDYYLAGKSTRWWGVAASIFGSNVSANHIVGMMGVGFSVGFAQSHFEFSAIAGLLLLCYGFLPMYRKLNVYTLSEYLGRRYDDKSRVAYAVIMVIVIVVIQMVPGFYIGSRSINLLLFDDGETAVAEAVVSTGQIESITVVNGGAGYVSAPQVEIDDGAGEGATRATAEATIENGQVASIRLAMAGTGYQSSDPPNVKLRGGGGIDPALSPGDVNPNWYKIGIVLMAVITGAYTILGGLKAVIVTDVIQSILLLLAGLIVAALLFAEPAVGGWSGMVALDSRPGGAQRLHLYNPSNHPQLPWTGVMSGLMVLHFYYWGANQFIVQRALSGRSDKEARLGIIAAGFFKLLIPFFSIGAGIAAYYYYGQQARTVSQDAVFTTLLADLVAPVGYGLVGLVAAGMIGAILSSLDSMMNSAATIITFDFYRRYMNPEASEQRLIWIGRVCIVICLVGAAGLTIFTMDPNSEDSFFLQIATHQSKLVAGVVVAFLLGMFWQRATAWGSFAAIITGVVFSYALPVLYAKMLVISPDEFARDAVAILGEELNFMHSVFLAAVLAVVAHVVVSLATKPDEESSQLTWVGQGIFSSAALRSFLSVFAASIAIYAVLACSIVFAGISPIPCAWIAGAWTWGAFAMAAYERHKQKGEAAALRATLTDDSFWAGLLAAAAVFMMFCFY